jgi:hypothetical protein
MDRAIHQPFGQHPLTRMAVRISRSVPPRDIDKDLMKVYGGSIGDKRQR